MTRTLVLAVFCALLSASVGAEPGVAEAPAADVTATPVDGQVLAQFDSLRGLLLKKRWKAAAKRWEKIPEAKREYPEALFLNAWLLMGQGQRDTALAILTRLGKSPAPDADVWRVVARRHPMFASLRADGKFRTAVGSETAQGVPPTTYMRLMGLGGQWEQSEIPCEEARVNLDLRFTDKRKHQFDLVIQTRCRGARETTRLDGTWRVAQQSLSLQFPNDDGSIETLPCQLEMCSDSSGEDCLRCRPDPELEFLLKPVRR